MKTTSPLLTKISNCGCVLYGSPRVEYWSIFYNSFGIIKADPTPWHGHTKHILLVDLCPLYGLRQKMIVLGKTLYCGCRLWHIYFAKSVIETLRPLPPTSHSPLGSSKSVTRKKRSLPPQNEEDMTQKTKTTSPDRPKFPIAVAFCRRLHAPSIEAFFTTPLALWRLIQPPLVDIPNIYY